MKPYFSVVIPTLNEEKWLPYLLSDLQNQTYPEFEVVVVDGNSQDKTKFAAEKFSQKLPSLKIINSRVRNVSAQRNQGGQLARGQYLLFIDADSRLPKYFLEGIKYKIQLTQAQLFTTWCQADSQQKSNQVIAQFLNLFLEAAYQLKNPGALGAMIGCQKIAFDTTHGFNPQIHYAEDGELFHRLYKTGLRTFIFRDPKFTYSLRRIRQTGTLTALRKYANIYLKLLLKSKINQPLEYPMGGQAVWKDQKTQSLLDQIVTVFKNARQRPSIAEYLESLLKFD